MLEASPELEAHNDLMRRGARGEGRGWRSSAWCGPLPRRRGPALSPPLSMPPAIYVRSGPHAHAAECRGTSYRLVCDVCVCSAADSRLRRVAWPAPGSTLFPGGAGGACRAVIDWHSPAVFATGARTYIACSCVGSEFNVHSTLDAYWTRARSDPGTSARRAPSTPAVATCPTRQNLKCRDYSREKWAAERRCRR